MIILKVKANPAHLLKKKSRSKTLWYQVDLVAFEEAREGNEVFFSTEKDILGLEDLPTFMHQISTYIWLKSMVHVGRYSIPKEHMG